MRFWLVLIVVLCSLLAGQAQQDEPTPIHSSTTIASTARYEIVQSTLAARWMFRLDRQTGSVYQIVKTKSDDIAWERMDVLQLPSAATSGIHYQLFLSGFAAKFTFLMNTDTGKTWQLQQNTDEKTKEVSYTWVPLE